MAHLWKVGDLAVCVDDSPVRYIDGLIETKREYVERLRKGEVYRVTHIARGKTVDCIGLGDFNKLAGGESTRFRPILPAEPAFTEAMRSLKPRVEA